jgi:hypothetical protein
MTVQPAVRTNPVALTDAYEGQQGLSQWAYRHKDLLDRFTSRET